MTESPEEYYATAQWPNVLHNMVHVCLFLCIFSIQLYIDYTASCNSVAAVGEQDQGTAAHVT